MSSNKKDSLGRGISALLGNALIEDQAGMSTLPIDHLVPCPYQPRKRFDPVQMQALTQSLKEKGILQPLLVRKVDDMYEIIAGERRWRAAKELDFQEVPVIIKDCSDQEAMELALIENVQRDDLTAIEEAEAYQKLIDEFHYTQDQLSISIGKSRSHVANTLRLLSLPERIKKMIQEGELSAGHGRALITTDNIDSILNEVIDKKLSVRETENLVKQKKQKMVSKEDTMSEMDQQADLLSSQLSEAFKNKTIVKLNQYGGTITIHFNSFEAMDDIMERLKETF